MQSRYVCHERRPLILFDLNGVLVHHHFDGNTHVHALRPGLHNLLRLKEHYDLGIYSSATERTVQFAMNKIDKGVGLGGSSKGQKRMQYGGKQNRLLVQGFPEYLPMEGCRELLSPFGSIKHFVLYTNTGTGVSKGEGVVSFEHEADAHVALQHLHGLKVGHSTLQVKRLYDTLFDVVLHREHCILASDAGFTREGGKPWDTVKPLEKYFQSHTARVVLIDDSSHKSWPGEEDSMVILPTWEDDSILQGGSGEQSSCFVLEKLTDIFINNTQGSFQDMVESARKEFSLVPSDVPLEISESESAEVLPVFSDRGGESPKITRNYLSPLHYELERFAHEATPLDSEIRRIREIVEKIETAATSIWPKSETYLFGSYAQGLSLPGSDLDITILGVGPTMKSSALGFSQREKGQINELLKQLLHKLMEADLVHESADIIQARIPVLKFNTRFLEGGELIPVDISFGTRNGLDAVQFVRANLISLPALRPMALFLKAVLKENNLNEVSTGGLGSYALMNIIIAYLQMNGHEAIFPDDLNASNQKTAVVKSFWESIARNPSRHGTTITWNAENAYSMKDGVDPGTYNQMTICFAQEISKHNTQSLQSQASDLGIFLWDFLDFFGSKLDFYNMAISVLKGGVTTKSPLFQNKSPWTLTVEDPQDSKHDVCCRTSDIYIIRNHFEELSRELAEYCDIDSQKEIPSHDVEKSLTDGSLLQDIVNVHLALDRGKTGILAREQNSERKIQKIQEIYGSTSNAKKYWVSRDKSRPKKAANLGVNTATLKKKLKKALRQKFYAVARGRNPGVYESLADCLAQVNSFKGNRYQCFKTLADAQTYLLENGVKTSQVKESNGEPTTYPPKLRVANATISKKSSRKKPPANRKGSKASKAVHAQWTGENRKKGQHFDMD